MSRQARPAKEETGRLNSALPARPARPAPLEEKPAANYLFVSNVRFLSMAAVVFVHCTTWFVPLTRLDPVGWPVCCLRQPFQFDVIGFFLISGFLMEKGLTRWRPAQYMKRRLQRIFLPWLFWYLVYCATMLAGPALHGQFRDHPWASNARWILHSLYNYMIGSAYWFIPNLMIALSILLACRRFLFDLRLGCALLAVSLFYGLNIHAHWIPLKNHTQALFGFVFYLWLGAWGARNFAAIEARIARTSALVLIPPAVLAGLAALLESRMLAAAGDPLPMNVLRISNQVYSIAVVLAIFKLRQPVWPRVVNVRTNTFGIYLIHPVLRGPLLRLFKQRPFGPFLLQGSSAAAVCFLLVTFAVIYASSLALAKWLLRHPRLRWMAGGFSSG